MSFEQLLPAVALPNQENEQDTTAIVQDGTKLRMAEFLQHIGPAPSLRFMINSRKPLQARDPRLTWQKLTDGQVVISAAFEYGKDGYSRKTSAAVIFLLPQATELIDTLPGILPREVSKDVSDAITEKKDEIIELIRHKIARGESGGEIGILKKKFPSLYILVVCSIILVVIGLIAWHAAQ